MRRSPAPTLTAERFRSMFSYDQATGIFTSKRKTCQKMPGDPVGALRPDGYLQIYIDGITHLAHRLAFLYMTGSWPADLVDHINHIRADNRWLNLREADSAINVQNTSVNHSGVERRGSRYRVRIRVRREILTIGNFPTEELAKAAYSEARRDLHEGFIDSMSRLERPPTEKQVETLNAIWDRVTEKG